MCLYISRYLFDVSCLMSLVLLSCLLISCLLSSIQFSQIAHHVIQIDSTYSVTFVFFLSFLVSRIFIMSKHHFDHLLLTESIFAENVQISSFCNYCAYLLFLCVLVNSLKKYSEYVHIKKLCFFSSQFFFCAEIFCLLHACEKLEQNQIIMKKEKKHLILYLFKFQSKSLCFCHHQQFLKKYDDKLI